MALSGIYEFEYTHQSEFCVAMYYSTQMVTLVLTMFLCVCIYISFLNRHIDVANQQFVIKQRIIGQFLANSGTNIPSKLKKKRIPVSFDDKLLQYGYWWKNETKITTFECVYSVHRHSFDMLEFSLLILISYEFWYVSGERGVYVCVLPFINMPFEPWMRKYELN